MTTSMQPRPNVVWFCTDQQRFDTIHALGNPHIRTPAIDRLVAGGMSLLNHYVQSPVCTPSRASFLTGRYTRTNGVNSNGNGKFPAHEVLVTRMLADAGYRCGLIGKLHLTGAQSGVENRTDDGYAVFEWSNMPRPEDGTSHNNAYHHWLRAKGHDPFELYKDVDALIGPGVPKALHQTTWMAETACDFIASSAGSPWLLSLNPFAPHHPFDPSPEYLDRYDPEDMPEPLFRESDLERQARFGNIQHQTYFPVDPRKFHPRGAEPHRFPDNMFVKHKGVPRDYYGKAFVAAYYAMIEQIDDAVGEIIAKLEETDQLDNTIFIFTSDHGEMLGDHGLLLKGARFFEGAVHVPMIVHWPARVAAGQRSKALTEAVDIAPTLLEAAGLEVPWFMQGKSLLPMLTGAAPADHHKDMVICEFLDAFGKLYAPDRTRATMTFDGRYKMISYHGHDLFELFDLEIDPGEFDNLWDAPGMAERRWDFYRRQVDLVAAQFLPSVTRTHLF
jgi:arylsulfatase